MTNTMIPTFEDVSLAKKSTRLLEEIRITEPAHARFEMGDRLVDLPPKLALLVKEALGNLAQGRGVSLISLEEEVTPQEAASLLSVSRPFAARLFDQGAIPSRRVGTHRRALTTDVLAYREKEKMARLKILDDLAAEGQRLGL